MHHLVLLQYVQLVTHPRIVVHEVLSLFGLVFKLLSEVLVVLESQPRRLQELTLL